MPSTTTRSSWTWISDFHNQTVLFKLGDWYFLTYGVLVAAAFSVGLAVAAWYYGAIGLDPVAMVSMSVLVLLPGVLLGARGFSALRDVKAILRNPVRTLLQPGYMLHGGVFGGIGAMSAWAWFTGAALLPVMDAWALAMPLGEAICRLGCFVYGCCYGKPTGSSLGICYHSHDAKVVRVRPQLRGVPLHPTQVYATAAHLAQFLLFLLALPFIEHAGVLAGLYLVTHPVLRVAIERFRLDDRGRIGKLTHTNMYSAVQFVAGGTMLSAAAWWSTRPALDWTGNMLAFADRPSAIALWGVLAVVAFLAFGLHYKKVGSWID